MSKYDDMLQKVFAQITDKIIPESSWWVERTDRPGQSDA